MSQPSEPVVRPLAAGAYLFETLMGGKMLRLTLLRDRDMTVLLDTGCAGQTDTFLLPCLRRIGLRPQDVDLVITSHSDTDHQGGNAAFRALSPHTRFACGDLDRALVESPALLWSDRYDAYRARFGHGYEPPVHDWVVAETGAPCAMDFTLRGGETLMLGPDRPVTVLHLPGHSAGHLALLDHKNRTLFGADALHGRGCPNMAGSGSVLCPTYEVIPAYRESIARVRRLGVDRYVGCHWPVCETPADVLRFCDLSENFVSAAEAAVLRGLARPGAAPALTDLCEFVGAQVGDWPAADSIHFCYAVAGHLHDLAQSGRLTLRRNGPSGRLAILP